MATTLKYPAEALKSYLSKHPTATYEEMAQVFSGTIGGLKKALHTHKIRLSSIPERRSLRPDPRYPKEALESYFASHPETTVKETAKFFGSSENALYKSAKRYGLTIPNRKIPYRNPPRKTPLQNFE